MSDAMNFIYVIFNKFVDFVFNTMQISDGVSFGYLIIVVGIFSVMIRNIIFLPKKGGNIKIDLKKKGDDKNE